MSSKGPRELTGECFPEDGVLCPVQATGPAGPPRRVRRTSAAVVQRNGPVGADPIRGHAHAREDAGVEHAVPWSSAVKQLRAIGIRPGNVEQVHAEESDDEAADQRERVDDVVGAQAPKKDERGYDSSRREADVVDGIDAGESPLVRRGGCEQVGKD